MAWRTSFCISPHVYFSDFLSSHFKKEGSFSPCSFCSWMKLDCWSSWPRRGRPCQARNRVLRKIVSSFSLLPFFSKLWAADKVLSTSCVCLGRVAWRSTASRWQSDASCFRNLLVASFQLQKPVEMKLLSVFGLATLPSFTAVIHMKQKARSRLCKEANS